MKNKAWIVSTIISIVLFFGAVGGWLYDSGVKKAENINLKYRIEQLEKSEVEQNEIIKKNTEILIKVAAILERLSNE